MAKAEKHDAPEPATNDLAALTEIWRSVASASDEDAQRTARQVLAKIRRLTAKSNCDAVHPGEPMVEITVPYPVGVGGATRQRFTITNSRRSQSFLGPVIVPQCIAQQLAYMISQNRQIDAARMKDEGRLHNVDDPVAARARAIMEA